MPREILAKSILNKHKKRDSWFLDDYSINPYMGCSVNCLYCYIRGSKYGVDMRVAVKTNAPEVLEKQLARRAEKSEYGIIAVASATDAYMPIEAERQLTRQSLQIILRYRFPVHVISKSSLILRDLDLLRTIDEQAILPQDLQAQFSRGAIIATSISTLDAELAQRFEPGAPPPQQRLETLARCKDAGLFCGVHFIPTLPFFSDSDAHLRDMTSAAKAHGADFVLVGSLTLFGHEPADSKLLYFNMLKRYYPELLPQYQARYASSTGPSFAIQRQLEKRARAICGQLDMKYGIL